MDPVSNAYHKAHLFKKTLLIAFCYTNEGTRRGFGNASSQMWHLPFSYLHCLVTYAQPPPLIYGSVYWTFA